MRAICTRRLYLAAQDTTRHSAPIAQFQKKVVNASSKSPIAPSTIQLRNSHSSTRNAGIQSFFQHLETNCGNLPSLIDQGPAGETIVSKDGILHSRDLVRLCRHEATALHVINYFEKNSAERLGEELLRESMGEYSLHGGGNEDDTDSIDGMGSMGGSSGRGGSNWKVSTPRGLESSDVMTLGEHSPYNVAVAQEQLLKASGGRGSNLSEENVSQSPIDCYFEGVQREFRLRRRRRLPSSDSTSDSTSDTEIANYYQLWPLDKLRLELDEAWPSGAGLAREDSKSKTNNNASLTNADISRRPFGGGLPRIMRGPTRWKRGFVHVDELGPLNQEKGLFSANIYLKMPDIANGPGTEDAGALYVWPLGVRSRWDWYRNAITLSSLSTQDPESQYHLHYKLGKPNIIRPQAGDLVLLCAQRPHCAVGFDEGVRVSLQCFLQYDGLDNRLMIDC